MFSERLSNPLLGVRNSCFAIFWDLCLPALLSSVSCHHRATVEVVPHRDSGASPCLAAQGAGRHPGSGLGQRSRPRLLLPVWDGDTFKPESLGSACIRVLVCRTCRFVMLLETPFQAWGLMLIFFFFSSKNLLRPGPGSESPPSSGNDEGKLHWGCDAVFSEPCSPRACSQLPPWC